MKKAMAHGSSKRRAATVFSIIAGLFVFPGSSILFSNKNSEEKLKKQLGNSEYIDLLVCTRHEANKHFNVFNAFL